MARRSWVWCPKRKELVEITTNTQPEQRAPMVVPDLPGYVSPVTGIWVEGRKARREDLKRTGSRPWEGIESERKEVARQHAYAEQKADVQLDRGVREVYYQMSPSKRRAIEGR